MSAAKPSTFISRLSSTKEADLHTIKAETAHLIERISSSKSSAVYVFDLAEQLGFGTVTKRLSSIDKAAANVIDIQTRSGAGLSLVGRLSQGTSQDSNGTVLTAYTSVTGLSIMAPALASLPPASASGRLVVHVPVLAPVGENFTLTPSLAPIATTLPILANDVAVIASSTPQEAFDFTNFTYKTTTSHIVHLFDQHSAAREIGAKLQATPEVPEGSILEVLKRAGYSPFKYYGDAAAEAVVVLVNTPFANQAKILANKLPGFGVLIVSVLRPWNEEAFLEVLPKTVKTVQVLDEVPNASIQGPVYLDVFTTLIEAAVNASVYGQRITPAKIQSFFADREAFVKYITSLVGIPLKAAPPLLPADTRELLILDTPKKVLSPVPQAIVDTFISSKAVSVQSLNDYDVFSKAGGVAYTRIALSPAEKSEGFVPVSLSIPIVNDQIDFVGVMDANLLKTHALVDLAKPGAVILVATTWSAPEFLSNLPGDVVEKIVHKGIHVYSIDDQAVSAGVIGAQTSIEVARPFVVHLAFLRLYLGRAASEPIVLKLARSTVEQQLVAAVLEQLSSETWAALAEIDIPAEAIPKELVPSNLKTINFNAVAIDVEDGETVVNGVRLGSWHDAAKHLLFPSAFTPISAPSAEEYPQDENLRPELPERTYLVTCIVNKRLTPTEYDRNVFHLEFDTSGTGLKYEIGEALGVHGWNDEQEVLDFCESYGVDPNRLVTIPVPGVEGRMHTRTVFQALQQQIDLFGRPPKSFYTDLAAYAGTSLDKHALLFIGSPEGSATFKKMAEKDTVTFAEVLMLYPSTKPGIETLCELIGDIKPRHYSIASAQSVVGDRVDLLVVTVDWFTPTGSPRYGQCTRYLAGLKVGQKVTVSIKPSVMKLPPDNKQPLIMAGLGTGAAPFRAFLQHRAMLASRGEPVGPVYYYFGSRHQSQEYLYGEEIEAFIQDKVITRPGLAFSRDQPKKIYIQHKMLEDAQALASMLRDQNGVFYLCGPTWPVPDVYEALVNALVKYNGMEAVQAGEYLESLKEEERYVLEVY